MKHIVTITDGEERLLKELRMAKETRKRLLNTYASPKNDTAQDFWTRGVLNVVIKYCDGVYDGDGTAV